MYFYIKFLLCQTIFLETGGKNMKLCYYCGARVIDYTHCNFFFVAYNMGNKSI